MEFAFITGFFTALAWWEIVIFIGLVGISAASLFEERGGIAFVGMLIILFVDWTGNGAFITVDSILNGWSLIIGYFVIGLLWSFFKWGRYVKYVISRFDNEEDIRYKLKQFSNDTIAYWIIWWPFSVIGFLFADVIDWIISHFKGVYNLIADKMISNAINQKS